MKYLTKLGIKTKIAIIVVLAIISFVATLGVNFFSSENNLKRLDKLHDNLYPLASIASQNAMLIERIEEQFTQAVSTSEEEMVQKAIDSYTVLEKNLSEITSLDSNSSPWVKDLKSTLTQYQALNLEIANGIINDTADFSKLPQQAEIKTGLYKTLVTELKGFQKSIDDQFQTLIAQSVAGVEKTGLIVLVIGIVLLTIMVVIALVVASSIVHNIQGVADSLEALATGEGDLNYKLPVKTSDDLGRLAIHFNSFMATLKSLILDVTQVATPLNKNAEDLKIKMSYVAKMSTQQGEEARNLHQSMENMQQSVKDISNSASVASEAAGQAEEQVNNGMEILSLSASTSNQLNTDSKTTFKIINRLADDAQNMNNILDVISAISEQTNLLALNAAIEAARAGESGRGFAVVADEVRTLAARSGEATTEIREMISLLKEAAHQAVNSMQTAMDASTKNVEHAESASSALEVIRKQILSINQHNTSIVTATEQQNTVATQAKDNAEQMSEVILQTQSTVQEMDEMMLALADFSNALTDSTQQFRL